MVSELNMVCQTTERDIVLLKRSRLRVKTPWETANCAVYDRRKLVDDARCLNLAPHALQSHHSPKVFFEYIQYLLAVHLFLWG
jgi:hypothetical protein